LIKGLRYEKSELRPLKRDEVENEEILKGKKFL